MDDYEKLVGLVQTQLHSSLHGGLVEVLMHMGMMELALFEPVDVDGTG